MTDNDITKAEDILNKLEFFYGQRAGRELWFEKPKEIQDQDIENFTKDIAFIKDYLNQQKIKIEQYEKTVGKLVIKNDEVVGLFHEKETVYIEKTIAETLKRMAIHEAKSKTRKEFAEELKDRIIHNDEIINRDSFVITNEINNLVKEMADDE